MSRTTWSARTAAPPRKEERKAAKRAKLLDKRAKLLDELIDAIPMQQLQRAFESSTSPGELRKLQRKHGFKESTTKFYTARSLLMLDSDRGLSKWGYRARFFLDVGSM